jgi:prepilin-type N-terminal cleavage/methylation domain-containing protein
VNYPSNLRSEDGFTIVEMLVATALFVILVLVIVAPITGLFGLTNKSAQQTNATNLAQQTIEQIRGQWLDGNRYGNNCVGVALPNTPVTASVLVQDEDFLGTPQANTTTFPAQTVPNCVSTPPSGVVSASGPPIRKITVTATVNGSPSTLVVEVARP